MGKKRQSADNRRASVDAPQQSASHHQSSVDTPLALKAGYAYVSLEGSMIEAFSNQEHPVNIPAHFVDNRIKRDGHAWHHVTVINPKELPRALEAIGIEYDKKNKRNQVGDLIKHLAQEFGDAALWEPPEDLGLACAQHGKSTAYYHVLHWPFGHRLRLRLGLDPAFFHITIGFDPVDVHGTYKGPGTLLCLRHKEFCKAQHLERLAELASCYHNDSEFLKALAKQSLCTYNYRTALSLAWGYLCWTPGKDEEHAHADRAENDDR